MKIYLSSTSKDLQEQRKAVRDTMQAMGHEVVWMEEYTADSMPPLTRVLEDVRNSQLYVGILARRYGDSPPESTKSFTENEYDEACKRSIPTICFLLDEKAAWPPHLEDDAKIDNRIQKFRERVAKGKMVKFFTTTDQLTNQVKVALINQIGTRAASPDSVKANATGTANPLNRAINLNPPMIGQKKARNSLNNALNRILDNHAMVVFVQGGLGSGKSKLIEWLCSRIGELGIETKPCGGSYYKGASNYRGIREIIQQVFKIKDESLVETSRLVAGHFSSWGFNAETDIIESLIDFMRPKMPNETGELEPDKQLRDQRRDVFFHQIAKPLIVASQHNPLIIYLEDLHSADEGSILFIEHMLASLREKGCKLLMVCTYEPTTTDTTTGTTLQEAIKRIEKGYDGNSTDFITLDPLDENEMGTLIKMMLGGAKLRGIEKVIKMAQGNPLYVVAIMQCLINAELVKEQEPGKECVLPENLDIIKMIPTKLKDLMKIQLDEIEKRTRENGALHRPIINWAALIGDRFSPKLLQLALEEAGEATLCSALESVLKHLVNYEKIFRWPRETSTGIRDLEFSQGLMREVVLEDIAGEFSIDMRHGCIARAMQKLYIDQIDGIAHQLADHYLKAGEPKNALAYFQVAAEVAQKEYNYSDACRNLKQAEGILRKTCNDQERQSRLAILLALGELVSISVSIPEAQQYYDEALGIARRLHQNREIVRANIGLGKVALLDGHQAEAVGKFTMAKKLCTDETLEDFWPRILKDNAQAYLRKGNYQETTKACNEWLEAYPNESYPALRTEVLRIRGTVCLYNGNLDDALNDFNNALSLAEDIGDRFQIAYCCNNIGEVYRKRSQLDPAEENHQRAFTIRKQIGDMVGIAMSNNNLGLINKARGLKKEAADFFTEAIKMAKAIGSKHREADSVNNLGTLMRLNGDYPKALELYDECYRIYSEGTMENEKAIVEGNKALTFYAQNQIPRAQELFRLSAENFIKNGSYACASLVYHNLVCMMTKEECDKNDMEVLKKKCRDAMSKAQGYFWPSPVSEEKYGTMVDMEDI